ncbi:hypothetical protein A1O3_07376 [Capronia epimyces CBS 606.96]|uniref:Threonine/serine exporter-like N-terminal domain-containing protein n=1 Tax=Capronia epimyces CBS 606.96 TaxID=1182542 RepID=W9XLJ5_9EURO|nr:uncharacterized protein A1O3_07376 [Capronia epimyces CBS 606.96]EXJ81088.1 hypothetical protein A1O3_07376 [Capronia epimyces CBS 606.96]
MSPALNPTSTLGITRRNPSGNRPSTAPATRPPSLARIGLISITAQEKSPLEKQFEADYHTKHLELTLKYGAPLVDRCGNDFPIYSCSKLEEGIEFDKMEDMAQIDRAVTEGRSPHNVGLVQLLEVERRMKLRSTTVRITAYGVACVAIGLYAFDTQLKDIIPAFLLGSILGWLQLVVTTRSKTVADLFPFLAGLLLTSVSLALGSLSLNGSPLFCWTALAEGTIAIILPSYTMLVATSEVLRGQHKKGAVRFAGATLYAIMLSFGMGCGKLLYGMFAWSQPPQPLGCFDG